MRYRAEFTGAPDAIAEVANRAMYRVGGVHEVRTDLSGGRSVLTFEAPDNYTARTLALNVQGDVTVKARIRRDLPMFSGPWFDLNEG